jgi:predicted 2-oxoglutarate/Fe(II)-dependent dioxygenase YbiX
VPLEDPVEKFVINALLRTGDHHGEHIDSFPFACSIPILQPPVEHGGCLQIAMPDAPHDLRNVEIADGDLVFFYSGSLVHRVTRISGGARRVVLNMAYATPDTCTERSSSRHLLYTPRAEIQRFS